jgi:hypothetical protein
MHSLETVHPCPSLPLFSQYRPSAPLLRASARGYQMISRRRFSHRAGRLALCQTMGRLLTHPVAATCRLFALGPHSTRHTQAARSISCRSPAGLARGRTRIVGVSISPSDNKSTQHLERSPGVQAALLKLSPDRDCLAVRDRLHAPTPHTAPRDVIRATGGLHRRIPLIRWFDTRRDGDGNKAASCAWTRASEGWWKNCFSAWCLFGVGSWEWANGTIADNRHDCHKPSSTRDAAAGGINLSD